MDEQPYHLGPVEDASVARPPDFSQHLDFFGVKPHVDDNAFHAEKRTTFPSESQARARKGALEVYWSARLALFLCRWKVYQILQLDRRRRLERIRLLTLSLLSPLG
jgi:hypothetical protein